MGDYTSKPTYPSALQESISAKSSCSSTVVSSSSLVSYRLLNFWTGLLKRPYVRRMEGFHRSTDSGKPRCSAAPAEANIRTIKSNSEYVSHQALAFLRLEVKSRLLHNEILLIHYLAARPINLTGYSIAADHSSGCQ
ncbi:hypothetical protein LshimejAT787_1104600 [Lyophyllum shimeji]|uniref:Uncharacterized protein n=1 Tax=Lyophyllum shimeji TaxID=47721 RepID=A0A9P3USG5_LYOSH|nr:hypothetical protein LshimejAT787_1104600 [Lyophyllum shimeji]